jgi:hypothetical protein
MYTLYTENLKSENTLKIMPRNLNEIVRSWIRLTIMYLLLLYTEENETPRKNGGGGGGGGWIKMNQVLLQNFPSAEKYYGY